MQFKNMSWHLSILCGLILSKRVCASCDKSPALSMLHLGLVWRPTATFAVKLGILADPTNLLRDGRVRLGQISTYM